MKKLNWTTTLFFTLTPLLGILGTLYVVLFHGLHWATLTLALFYVFATGLSITAGYHRLFSHMTYKASAPVRLFYLLFGAAAFEGSVLEWCTDHRNHHRYTDQEKDPYSVARTSLWYAHIGWILYLDPSRRDFKNVEDLTKDPLVAWQHKYYVIIATFMSFILPMLIAACWGDALGGLFIVGALRVTINHHFTFFINSLCHYFGKKTYANSTARDNWIMSLVTYGEGFHNFHHQFATDYRNGVRWYHFDPSKWLIWSLAKLGLAHGLKCVDDELLIKFRLQMEEQHLREMQGVCPTRSEELLKPIRDRLHILHVQLIKLRKEYAAAKADKMTAMKTHYKIRLQEYKENILTCRKDFDAAVQDWAEAKRRLLHKPPGAMA